MNIQNGDFVEVMGGKSKGEVGTVIKVENNQVAIDLPEGPAILIVGMVKLL